MSKISTDPLHELILNLSKSEKRYFKLRSSQHTIGEQNNYLALFDYLEKSAEYNETQLKNNFKKEAFINRLSISKKRLYDAILSSLDQYHQQNSVEANLYKMLNSFDILYTKSLYAQCNKILKSAEKIAAKYDAFHVTQEILKRSKKLIETENYLNTDNQKIDKILADDLKISKQIDLYNELWSIKSKIFIRLNKNSLSRSKDDILEITEIINNTKDLTKNQVLHFEAEYLFNHILSACYYSLSEFDQSLKYINSNVNLFENNPQNISENQSNYIGVLANCMHLTEKIGNVTEINDVLLKTRNIRKELNKTANEDLNIKIFSSLISAELSLAIKKGNETQTLALIEEIKENLKNYSSKLSFTRLIFFHYQISVVYTMLHEYKKASFHIKKLFAFDDFDKKEDLYYHSLLLDLLINFESGKKDLVSYGLQNVKRALKRKNKIYEYEDIFLQMISCFMASKNKFDLEEILENFHLKLTTLKSNPKEAAAFEYFDLIKWMENKLDLLKRGKVLAG